MQECGRQFVENPQNKIIPLETWELADKLLPEKIPIAGISRVTGISNHGCKNTLMKNTKIFPKKLIL